MVHLSLPLFLAVSHENFSGVFPIHIHLKLWLTPSWPPLLSYFSSIASHCLFISVHTSAISVIHKTSLTHWQPLALSPLFCLNSPRFDYTLHYVITLGTDARPALSLSNNVFTYSTSVFPCCCCFIANKSIHALKQELLVFIFLVG